MLYLFYLIHFVMLQEQFKTLYSNIYGPDCQFKAKIDLYKFRNVKLCINYNI